MLALDRIYVVPLMFQVVYGALARALGHAKVTGMPGRNACAPLAARASRAYLSQLPAPTPCDETTAVPPFWRTEPWT
jgi:hypothetical protein